MNIQANSPWAHLIDTTANALFASVLVLLPFTSLIALVAAGYSLYIGLLEPVRFFVIVGFHTGTAGSLLWLAVAMSVFWAELFQWLFGRHPKTQLYLGSLLMAVATAAGVGWNVLLYWYPIGLLVQFVDLWRLS